MKKLRILIIRNAYQKDTGGAEQYSVNLAQALQDAGHKPYLVTKHKAIKKQAEQHGIPTIHSVWHEKQEWDRWYYVRKFYTTLWYIWIILSRRIQVVNPQSRDDFVFATNAAKLLRRRVIWTDHADLKYLMDRVNHYHPRMQAWLSAASQYATKIVCVSKSEQASITKVAPELKNKLTVVYNGVFKPTGVKPVEKHGFVIGTNARLVPAKGISELIEAFSNVQKIEPKSELWLVGGESGNKQMYEDLAKHFDVDKKVHIIGYVLNPNDYVASMDIFVHASYHEAFSLAIIEAAMLGKPIIATDVGGTPEIIDGHTGILIPPQSANELTNALTKLMKAPGRAAQLGQAAQSKAEAEFDFQTIVKTKLIPIYRGSK